jgi:ABC-2 type transport system ATP-binding protein
MSAVILSVRALSAQYGRRLVFDDVSFDLGAGQCLGVVGPNGSGKTTLLRTIVGCLAPRSGDVRISGLVPRDALSRTEVAYFAGEATLPGFARASAWGKLGTSDTVTRDRRRLRALSRGTRQLLGLRTVLGRQQLGLVVLDEPWEGLDPDGARWLSSILELKRDRGAALILASHRLHDLSGLCDLYLLLYRHRSALIRTHELGPAEALTPERLTDVFDRVRAGAQVPLEALPGEAPGGDGEGARAAPRS